MERILMQRRSHECQEDRRNQEKQASLPPSAQRPGARAETTPTAMNADGSTPSGVKMPDGELNTLINCQKICLRSASERGGNGRNAKPHQRCQEIVLGNESTRNPVADRRSSRPTPGSSPRMRAPRASPFERQPSESGKIRRPRARAPEDERTRRRSLRMR